MLHTHSPIWLRLCFPDMADNAAPDSKRFKTVFTCCGSVHLTRRDDPSLSCLHPRACLTEVCVPDPLSLHSVTWAEDVQSDVHRVCPCSRDVVLSCESACFLTLLQLRCIYIEICLRVRCCLNNQPCHSELHAQRCSIRAFRCRSWQPIHSTVFLQLCRI